MKKISVLQAIKELASRQPVLLWENPTPNQNFNRTTLQLDLSKYSYIEIYHLEDAYYNMVCNGCLRLKKGEGGYIKNETNVPSVNAVRRNIRYCSFSENGVYFEDGITRPDGYPYTPDDSFCIPYRIYGIK